MPDLTLSNVLAKRAEVKKELDHLWKDFEAVRGELGDKLLQNGLSEKNGDLAHVEDRHNAVLAKNDEWQRLGDLAHKLALMESTRHPDDPEVAEQKGGTERPGPAAGGAVEGKGYHEWQPQAEWKSPGQRFIESKAYKDLIAMGVAREGSRAAFNSGNVDVLDRVETKTLLQSYGAPGTTLIRNDRLPGIAPFRQAPITLLDLVTVGDTDGNVVEWIQQNSFTNNAAEVAEATATAGTSGTKPESALGFTVASTTVRNIAHWIPATRSALADMGQLRTIIDTNLVDGVRRRLNGQMMSGDGTAPNLRGILNTVGIGTTAVGVSPDDRLQAFARGILAVRLAFFEPDSVLLNPNDYLDIRLMRDSSGGANTGQYLFGPPSTAGLETIWGLPMRQTTELPSGTGLVGDFSQAILYQREGIQVLTTDSHSDFFIRNAIVILAEGRWAFAVPYPTAFATVTAI